MYCTSNDKPLHKTAVAKHCAWNPVFKHTQSTKKLALQDLAALQSKYSLIGIRPPSAIGDVAQFLSSLLPAPQHLHHDIFDNTSDGMCGIEKTDSGNVLPTSSL